MAQVVFGSAKLLDLLGPAYALTFFFFNVKNICGFSSHNAFHDYKERSNIQKYPKELPGSWERQT